MRYLFSLLIFFLLFFSAEIFAQQEYTINGEQLVLIMEVEGPLTLLWKKENKEYRFFSKKGEQIEELKNTQIGRKFQEEYKETLKNQTGNVDISVKNVQFSPRSFTNFFNKYNSLVDSDYAMAQEQSKSAFRLGVFGGVNNTIFRNNITNSLHGVAGIDFEFADPGLKRHSFVLQFQQTFRNSDHDFQLSQLSFNYRFKFITLRKFDAFLNLKFAAFSYVDETWEIDSKTSTDPIIESQSGLEVDAPFIFGVGFDYKIGNGYLTLGFNDFVALNRKSNKEFPVNFTLGYKFIL